MPDFPVTALARDDVTGDLLRGFRLRCHAAAVRHHYLGRRRLGLAHGRSGGSDHRAEFAGPVRGNARTQRLEADTAVKLVS